MADFSEKDIAATKVPAYAQSWDKAVEQRLVRKTDFILIPLFFCGYSLVYYDKAVLGGAAVFGMITDLKLRVVVDPSTTPPKTSTLRLSWATSLFYFGMLAGLFPMTYLFQRFRVGRTIGTVIVLWGATVMCTAAVTNYEGLFAQRFFLGFAESVIPTAFMCIITGYYTQAEQTWRQCLWYSSTGGMTILGSVINYGFAHIHNAPLKSWQYLYLTLGTLTMLFGVVMFFLPNSPADAWWFTEEEKVVAIERLRGGQLGTRCQKIKSNQIKEAIFDVKVWIISSMMGIAYVINGAVSGLYENGPLIVSTFGYDAYSALLWQLPLAAIAFFSILLVGFLSLKMKNIRLLMLSACCFPVVAGCAMIWKSGWYHHAATPLAGYSLLGFFAPVTSLVVSLGMANIAGASKKSFMAAATFTMYCIGNIVGPQLIVTETVGQHYPRLWEACITCYALLVVLSVALYFHLRRENVRRDALHLTKEEGDKIAFDDLTDKQNLHFRYTY